MAWFMSKAVKLIPGEDGVTAIEYALIASLIAVVIVVAVTAVGGQLVLLFESVVDAFP